MTHEEEIEFTEFKNELYSLKKNEKLMYYIGKTPCDYSSDLDRAKFREVMTAYRRGIVSPLQKLVHVRKLKHVPNHSQLRTFEYMAVGR